MATGLWQCRGVVSRIDDRSWSFAITEAVVLLDEGDVRGTVARE